MDLFNFIHVIMKHQESQDGVDNVKSCRERSHDVSMMLTLPPGVVADDAGCEDEGLCLIFDVR